MRCRRDTTWFWNTGQDKRNFLNLFFVLLCVSHVCGRPDFIDSMSQQFFGFSSDSNRQSEQQQYQSTPDPFAQMFGSSSQQVPQRPPNRNYVNHNQHQGNPPHRQGYYAPPHVVQKQVHLPYNGPPPVYGQQQGFGQRQPNSNETKTDGYPPDNTRPQHPYPDQHHQAARHYPPTEYHHQHPQVVEYHKPPATVVEYQTEYHQHPPQQVEYHHIPPQPAIVEEHHGPALEIHAGKVHHEPPTHVEYHHPPEVEYHHHHPVEKPKKFHLSFSQSPDLRIIDKHLKLPPVKFRFHINPKIVITSNTKDPLDKKHHDDEHDLEPFPPPDAFSDPNAPPSINKHIIEHYPVKHHYPVEHHVVNHYAAEYPQAKHAYAAEYPQAKHAYAAEYPQAKHAYPAEHHVVEHHPGQEYVYDLSHGHSHVNPHRSLGHYEPTFKVKTKPIIFTEPPPTRPTTTTRATTTTARTTTARTTTTARPTRRARISARNPAFSVAFTQSSATDSTTSPSTTSSTTTRRSIFRSNSERERENVGISERKDELSTSAESPATTLARTTTTTTTTTATPSTTSTTTSSTTPKPSSTSTTTTTMPSTTFSTTRSTTTTTTTSPTTTTTTTTPRPETTTTTPTTTSTSTTVTQPTTTTKRSTTQTTRAVDTSTAQSVSRSTRITPAEETTPRTTTLSADANEIDTQKTTEAPRRRPEPLQDKSPSIDRSESYNFESSESVKVIETTMLIDGKNQTVRFYYITQPVRLPLDVFQKMTGQVNGKPSGVNVIKIRDKRQARSVSSVSDHEMEILHDL